MARRRVTFPKIGEKHSLDPVFSARIAVPQFYPGGKVPKVPRKAVLIFDRKMEERMARKDWLRDSAGMYAMSRRDLKAADGSMGVFRIAIGAPMTAMAVEELSAQGAEEFLILGTAGGVVAPAPGELVLCTKALRDEGTSHHYLPESRYAYPDRSLVRRLGAAMKKAGMRFSAGPSWTTDAPYRETGKEVARYHRDGVLTVEMEAAALFASARALGASAAAVFMVSDRLTPDGWSGFVKGRRPAELEELAAVADVFRSLGPGKR
jgi:uridine phosphorylase